MNANYLYSFLAVVVLSLIAYVGVEAAGLEVVFGIIIPYAAVIIFIAGFIYKVMGWARSAVPFRITTTAGQQKSLPWFQQAKIDCPSSKWAVVVRMALEIFCFRSLFRNTTMKMKAGPKITYQLELFLWLGALAFHAAFFTVLIRHMRFFTEPVPYLLQVLENLDAFLRIEVSYEFIKVGLPGFYLSGILLLVAVSYLFIRRVVMPQVKYISLASDFFPLFLIFGIAFTGILMRYFAKIDITAAKTLTMGLATLHPNIPEGIGGLFYVHLFFVCVLLAYFPLQ